jgi:hypothetical protein
MDKFDIMVNILTNAIEEKDNNKPITFLHLWNIMQKVQSIYNELEENTEKTLNEILEEDSYYELEE